MIVTHVWSQTGWKILFEVTRNGVIVATFVNQQFSPVDQQDILSPLF
jgi:hypothetical protein